jgi:hypothetical protein
MQTTKNYFRLASLVSLFLLLACFAISPAKAATELRVYNSSSQSVDVWWNGTNPTADNLTVKTLNGRPVTVAVPGTFGGGKGVFTLAPGQTVSVARTNGGTVLNGTITFNCIPVCPCGGPSQPPCPVVPGFTLPSKLVNGVNQCEFALNTGFESVDISCVNGANCQTTMNMAGGSPVWKNNITKQPVGTIGNQRVDVSKRIDGNCNNVGVFPFNATDCIQTPNPPCGTPFCFHATRDCQLDRQGSGGTVTCVINQFYAF